MQQEEKDPTEESTLSDSISGAVQRIIGDIEVVGGVLTGDPITQAEGHFNEEVGEIREDLEDEGVDDDA